MPEHFDASAVAESLGVDVAGCLPLALTPARPVVDVRSWASEHAGELESQLRRHGAILFRDFPVDSPDAFEAFALNLSSAGPVRYREAATPRSQVTGNIFTSTEYPAERTIFAHNENSHTLTWPGKLFFYCEQPPASGGETPLTDCRAVYDRIDADIRARFLEQGWLYRRYFGPGGRFDWQTVFGARTAQEATEYFDANAMVACFDGDDLVVWYHRWAAAHHPGTGDPLWFNHGTFFNQWSLEPELLDFVLEVGPERLPYNTFYGNGDPVASEVIAHLRAAYLAETVSFPWHRGDVLMVDNMRLAHGRRSFTGDRRVLVTMTEQLAADVAWTAASPAGTVLVSTSPAATVPTRIPAP
jgi:alpha-ketoglutarate-dependent taurine dioxygenase